MRDFVISNSLKAIRRSNPNYDDEKMEVVEYGLTYLYMFMSKSIVIFTIAYFIGMFKQLLIFMFIYSLIRSVSFGMHAKSSYACLIASSLTFLSTTLICMNIAIPINIKMIFGLISIIIFWIYAPADTEKKPIVNPKRRFAYKLLSIMISIMMVCCSVIIKNDFISNSFICALMVQCVMICPITYKLSNQKYNNYIDYQV